MQAFLCADFSPAAMEKIAPYLGDLAQQRVLLMTTAAIGEGILPDEAKNIVPFTARGAHVESYDVAGQTPEQVTEKVRGADIICVAGGNTFYLLEHLRACRFQEILATPWAQGKVYIGSSAGSIVTGPDIEFIKPMDDPSKSQLGDYRGFGWIDFLFLPHWQTPAMPAIRAAAHAIVAAHRDEVPMLVLEDHQVVYVPDVTKKLIRIL